MSRIPETFLLRDGDEIIACELCDTISVEDQNYSILLPEDPEKTWVYIGIISDVDPDKTYEFMPLKDEAVFLKVFTLFSERHADEFSFS